MCKLIKIKFMIRRLGYRLKKYQSKDEIYQYFSGLRKITKKNKDKILMYINKYVPKEDVEEIQFAFLSYYAIYNS